MPMGLASLETHRAEGCGRAYCQMAWLVVSLARRAFLLRLASMVAPVLRNPCGGPTGSAILRHLLHAASHLRSPPTSPPCRERALSLAPLGPTATVAPAIDRNSAQGTWLQALDDVCQAKKQSTSSKQEAERWEVELALKHASLPPMPVLPLFSKMSSAMMAAKT